MLTNVKNITDLSTKLLTQIFEYVPFDSSNWAHWSRTCKLFNKVAELALKDKPCAATMGNLPIKRAAKFGNLSIDNV